MVTVLELERLAKFSFVIWCFIAVADYVTTIYGVTFLGLSESNLLGYPSCLLLASVVAIVSVILFKISGKMGLENRSLLFISIWLFFMVVAIIQVHAVVSNFRMILESTVELKLLC